MGWRDVLKGEIDGALLEEIDQFSRQIEARRAGRIEESVFGEIRLRRGVYGQRYDNAKRHDGEAERALAYPGGAPSKGPNTVWDAPGMQRIKVPYGGLNADQLERLADVAEEYSVGIMHVTTRQDLQLHYIHVEDTPDLMYRLAAVGLTTKEACGNSVRNITGCAYAGVCPGETFDPTPYARALADYLLGHPDAQDFGRKFKIAFSGCADQPCGLTRMHDLGFVAKVREGADGLERGFEIHVGGGLGAVPHQAQVLSEFLPVEELLPVTLAVCRVFAQHGEKKNRARARLKFLIPKLGFESFKALVFEEREKLQADPRWSAPIRAIDAEPGVQLVRLERRSDDAGFRLWKDRNVRAQKQAGFSSVLIALPLGDLSAKQARLLAHIVRAHGPDGLRGTVDQNLLLRWVKAEDLPTVYALLSEAQLAEAEAETVRNITACPGTDTCKLGIASSRGLALALRAGIDNEAVDPAVRALRIKISGCFNSCGHHHVADIGFYGATRKRNGHAVPHFQLVVGGQWSENAGAFGLAIAALPSRVIPAVVQRLTTAFVERREVGEGFRQWVERMGRAEVKALVSDLTEVPALDDAPEYYNDWADIRRYGTADMAKGECAGEIVPLAEFGLAQAEQELFSAQIELEQLKFEAAADQAVRAMHVAAKALVQTKDRYIEDAAPTVKSAFQEHFCETRVFYDRFAGGKFASYFLRSEPGLASDAVAARQLVEEASLFVEAAHACYLRLAA